SCLSRSAHRLASRRLKTGERVTYSRTEILGSAVLVTVAGSLLAADALRRSGLEHLRTELRTEASCALLQTQIERARGVGRPRSTPAMAETDLVTVLEEAGRASGLSAGALTRIWPGTPRAIDGGEYMERPTDVQIHGATLP